MFAIRSSNLEDWNMFEMKKSLLPILLIISMGVAAQQPQATKPPVKSTAPPAQAVAAATAPPAKSSSAARAVPWVNQKLENGLEVIVLTDHSVPLVTVEMAIRMGSFRESPEWNGYSHLYEHMFFKENRAVVNREPYLNDIGQKGISYNGTTREEVSTFYLTAMSEHLPLLLRFLKDAARYPTFNPQQLEREREIVVEEVTRNESNPYFWLNEGLNRQLFFGQASRKYPGGRPAVLRAATPEKLREWQRRFVIPNNAVLVFTGDVEPAEALRQASTFFGDWQRGDETALTSEVPKFAPLVKNIAAIVEQPVENVLVQVGWQGPSIGVDTPATHAADVFSYILSQESSRFHRALVDSGLTTVAALGYYTQRHVGPINLTFQTTPEKFRAAFKAVLAEVARFNSAGYYTDQELENAKEYLAADDLYSREKPTEYAHTLSFWWSTAGADYFRNYQPELRRVSREEISRYVREYIQKPRAVVVLLSHEAQNQLKLTPEELTAP
jgi:zinc protease